MKKNECFSLTAERFGADLEGVCIHDGMPVFVPGLLPGETATVRIVATGLSYTKNPFSAIKGFRRKPAAHPHTSSVKIPLFVWPRIRFFPFRPGKNHTNLSSFSKMYG